MAQFRITSTYSELVQLLGAILRTSLGFKILLAECWTFTLEEAFLGDRSITPDTYFGKGHFFAKIAKADIACHGQGQSEDTVEVSTKCELLASPDGNEWAIDIWLKLPNGTVRGHRFEIASGFIPSGCIPQETRVKSAYPPAEIAFK